MKKCYISTIPACDGFGARFQRSLNLLFFSLYVRDNINENVEFLYSPLSYEGFGKSFYDRPAPANFYYTTKEVYKERATLWDSKLRYNDVHITDVNLKDLHVIFNVSYQEMFNQIKNNECGNKLYLFDNLSHQYDHNILDINIIDKYRDEVLSRFDLVNPFNDDFNISLHIRRDDVNPNMKLRWLEDEYYLRVIDIIEKNIKFPYNLNIHTQKQNFNFDNFKNYNVKYDGITQDYESFLELIFSDILVLGKSSFGYAAAYLNKNLVVYHDFWHKKLDSWIKIEQLEEQLKNKKNNEKTYNK